MNKKNIIPFITLGMCIFYFISVIASVAGLIITGKSFLPAVIALELATALSTPVFLLMFEAIPMGASKDKKKAKELSIIFMACCMVLTMAVHFVQLLLTNPLIESGVQVPTYFQVGYWPSVSMSVEYLAWGFFMGAAFLSSSFAVGKDCKRLKLLKYTLLICGILCFAGLLLVILIHENCWYIASLGYGIGTVIVCIELIFINNKKL